MSNSTTTGSGVRTAPDAPARHSHDQDTLVGSRVRRLADFIPGREPVGHTVRDLPVAALIVFVVIAAVLAVQSLVRADVTAEDLVVRSDAPIASLTVTGSPFAVSQQDVRLAVNGSDVTDGFEIVGSELHLDTSGLDLSDGLHLLEVSAASRTLPDLGSQTLSLRVDNSAPHVAARIQAPTAPGQSVYASNALTVAVKADAGSTVTVTAPGNHVRQQDGSPAGAAFPLRLGSGSQVIGVRATDAAGNATHQARTITIDAVPPRFTVPASLARPTRDDFTLTVTDSSAWTATVSLGSDDVGQASGTGTGAVTVTLPTDLTDGEHTLVASAEDAAGNAVARDIPLVLDTSETLGVVGLSTGARGADVTALQRWLVDHTYTDAQALGDEKSSRTYGDETAAAVGRAQETRGLETTGIADMATLGALLHRIEINRASNRLTLFRADEPVRTYIIATGSAAHPTPAGTFTIINKQENPTWIPPDSDWAEGEKPIPPGPTNPLGTRWMGIDSPAVGIHGTNSPASLGYSVSHGCIRMAIPEVEELYSIVGVGTPVTIL